VKRGPAAGLTRTGLTAVAAVGAARAAYAALTRFPPGGAKTWTRTNHRGEPVTLLEGPAVAAGAVAAVLLRGVPGAGGDRGRESPMRGNCPPGLAQFSSERTRFPARAALALAGAGAGAFGFGVYDDLAGSGKRRGLRGHLGALAHGEVTTGAVKLGGLGATGLASALALGGPPADVVVNAGLIAGGANLLNLFDLRPGRAIKVATASAALIAAAGGAEGRRAVAAPLGAALGLLPEDLGERAMLGDAGANAIGAMLGGAAAASLPRPARIALLAGIVALTGASEKVSFTKVIERTPSLRWLDMLGRRPPVAVPAPRRDPEPAGVGTGRSEDSGTTRPREP
jgi:UDP-GlcNAc:undecaprenyl-phosphate/decaprenyl-phosphate GlcNAc-1-phosphate transferase